MKLNQLINHGTERLREVGIEECMLDAKILAMHVCKMDYSDLFLHFLDEVSPEKYHEYLDCIERRCRHIPTQYIVGHTGFMGYEFLVKENVLIPRPETELLVEKALDMTKSFEKVRVLDMCCGSGCIGISYKLERKNLVTEVVMADISDYAVALSKENNERFSTGCEIIQTDLFEKISGCFDMIMSNPPYIKTSEIETLMSEVKDYEPVLALDGMEDGLFFYRRLINEGSKHLKSGGCMIFETGYDQYKDISSLLKEAGYIDIGLIKDYAGLDRVIYATKA